MKNRNGIVSAVPKATEEERDLFRPDPQGLSTRPKEAEVDQGNLDLFADILNFIAFQVSLSNFKSCLIICNIRLQLMKRLVHLNLWEIPDVNTRPAEFSIQSFLAAYL